MDRRGRPRLLVARPADDERNRVHAGGRARRRLGGRRGRFAGHRRRTRRRSRPPRRHDRDGLRVRRSPTTPARRADARRGPVGRADILGDRLPTASPAAYRRYRHGPGVFKVDFASRAAFRGPRPRPAAGTVHLGGGIDEVVAGERAVHRGHDARPAVRARRPAVPRRPEPVGRQRPPAVDVRARAARLHRRRHRAIIAQIERFAPGFRERIVGMAVRSTTEMSVYNPNYIGGDVIGGASSLTQLLFRPRLALDPYSTGIPGTYLCSASTPPGAGAHGMCGANAAARRAGTAWLLNPGLTTLESSFQLDRESDRRLRHTGPPHEPRASTCCPRGSGPSRSRQSSPRSPSRF